MIVPTANEIFLLLDPSPSAVVRAFLEHIRADWFPLCPAWTNKKDTCRAVGAAVVADAENLVRKFYHAYFAFMLDARDRWLLRQSFKNGGRYRGIAKKMPWVVRQGSDEKSVGILFDSNRVGPSTMLAENGHINEDALSLDGTDRAAVLDRCHGIDGLRVFNTEPHGEFAFVVRNSSYDAFKLALQESRKANEPKIVFRPSFKRATKGLWRDFTADRGLRCDADGFFHVVVLRPDQVETYLNVRDEVANCFMVLKDNYHGIGYARHRMVLFAKHSEMRFFWQVDDSVSRCWHVKKSRREAVSLAKLLKTSWNYLIDGLGEDWVENNVALAMPAKNASNRGVATFYRLFYASSCVLTNVKALVETKLNYDPRLKAAEDILLSCQALAAQKVVVKMPYHIAGKKTMDGGASEQVQVMRPRLKAAMAPTKNLVRRVTKLKTKQPPLPRHPHENDENVGANLTAASFKDRGLIDDNGIAAADGGNTQIAPIAPRVFPTVQKMRWGNKNKLHWEACRSSKSMFRPQVVDRIHWPPAESDRWCGHCRTLSDPPTADAPPPADGDENPQASVVAKNKGGKYHFTDARGNAPPSCPFYGSANLRIPVSQWPDVDDKRWCKRCRQGGRTPPSLSAVDRALAQS